MPKKNILKLVLVTIFVSGFVNIVYFDNNRKDYIEVSKFIDSGIVAISEKLDSGYSFNAFYDKCYSIILNENKVYFVTGNIIGGEHISTICLLVDENGELVKELRGFNNVYVKDTIFEDLNEDGLLD